MTATAKHEKTIWKFQFPVQDQVEVMMPQDAKVVAVGLQQPRHICLWAIVAPERPQEARTFYVRGTGHPLPLEPYLGTVADAPFVWHVFGWNL